MEYQAKYQDTIMLISNIHKMNYENTFRAYIMGVSNQQRSVFYFGSGRIFVHCLVDSCTYLFSLHTVVLEKKSSNFIWSSGRINFLLTVSSVPPGPDCNPPLPNKKEVWMSKAGRGVPCRLYCQCPWAIYQGTSLVPDSFMTLHPRVAIFWMISSLEHHWTELH